jgi:hypothetical protein
MLPPPPSPSGCGRLVWKCLRNNKLGCLTVAKFVHPKGLSLNSSFQRVYSLDFAADLVQTSFRKLSCSFQIACLQIRPFKGLSARSRLISDRSAQNRTLPNKSARGVRGRFVYLYFQSSEIDGVKWQVSEQVPVSVSN